MSLLLTLGTAQAKVDAAYQVKSIEIVDITERRPTKPIDNMVDDEPTPSETTPPPTDRIEQTGRIISTAKDVVALGEAIYELINKGRPKITTTYAPISVIPKDPTTKEVVDFADMEGFSMPVEKRFLAKVKNMANQEVVNFEYRLMYSYGGSYNGKGKYLTGVIIIPGNIRAKKGWNIDSSMSLSGIMNHGTKENPVAGAIITIKYSLSSMFSAFERNDTIHITGNGEMKAFLQ